MRYRRTTDTLSARIKSRKTSSAAIRLRTGGLLESRACISQSCTIAARRCCPVRPISHANGHGTDARSDENRCSPVGMTRSPNEGCRTVSASRGMKISFPSRMWCSRTRRPSIPQLIPSMLPETTDVEQGFSACHDVMSAVLEIGPPSSSCVTHPCSHCVPTRRRYRCVDVCEWFGLGEHSRSRRSGAG